LFDVKILLQKACHPKMYASDLLKLHLVCFLPVNASAGNKFPDRYVSAETLYDIDFYQIRKAGITKIYGGDWLFQPENAVTFV